MQNILIFVFAPVMIALSAWTYTNILTDYGMLLNGVYQWCDKHLPEWLNKPLIACAYCVAGQWALWLYFFLLPYNLFAHVYFILGTIFFVEVITKTMTNETT
jgi:hypothetical protein